MNKASVFIAIAFATAAPVFAAKPQPTAPAPMKPEAVWRATCGYCHGSVPGAPELRGMGLPEAAIVATARQGAPGMPVFHASEISDADLQALARWIARQPKPQKAAP